MNLNRILAWIPGWLGFLLLILVGVAMLIHGAANPLGVTLDSTNRAGFIIFGLCAALVGAFSWIAGGTSRVKDRAGTVGVLVGVSDLPWWAWVADVGAIALAVVVFLVVK